MNDQINMNDSTVQTTEATQTVVAPQAIPQAVPQVQRRGYKRPAQATIYALACGCCNTSRRGPVQLPDGSWAVACYWGPASHPEDARLHLPKGETIIGVQAVDAALGL